MNLYLTKDFDSGRNLQLVDDNEKLHFPLTRFQFIQNHRSFRPGCMHVLLGNTGAGKTTLTRTILKDVSAEKKILWYSTEETKDQFQTQNAYSQFVDYKNIRFFTEADILERLDMKFSDPEPFIKQIDWAIAESKPDMLVFDNITTSVFYDQNKKAPQLTQMLRDLMRSRNIPIFIIAHTASNIRDGVWFSSSDVRGFRNITNTAEYTYCLMRYRVPETDQLASFVYVDKSRLHGGAKEIYRLHYDPVLRTITSDATVSYERFMEFVKKGQQRK